VSDDYLWDRSGPPDPEIEQLERTLAPLRAPTTPLRALESTPPLPGAPAAAAHPLRPRRRWLLAGGLALAGAAGAAGAVALVGRSGRRPSAGGVPAEAPVGSGGPPPAGWALTIVSGRPQLEGRPPVPLTRLAVGETLLTDADGRARLDVPGVGTVRIDPRTRVQLLGTAAHAHRLKLLGGVLHASIFAPPGTFFIETPAGVAVDLGCVYSVQVGADGDGLISVQSGWVGFQQAGRESFIPEGASCAIRVRNGPGTPGYDDAAPAFREALTRFDTDGASVEQARALRTLLAGARPRDAVTLWHLLARAPAEARPRVLARLRALVPRTSTVAADRVLAGERAALDQVWDRLGLGPITRWRRWRADLDRNPGR
jgi:hypothetical protein